MQVARRLLIQILVVLFCLIFVFGCTSKVTSTKATPTPLTTAQKIQSFLDKAKNSYNTGAGVGLKPNISGISISDFLSLTIQSDSIITMNGIPYDYKDFNYSESVTLRDYTVTFHLGLVIPGVGTEHYTVDVEKNNQKIDEFELIISPGDVSQYSVEVVSHLTENLLFLNIGYPLNPTPHQAGDYRIDDDILLLYPQ